MAERQFLLLNVTECVYRIQHNLLEMHLSAYVYHHRKFNRSKVKPFYIY